MVNTDWGLLIVEKTYFFNWFFLTLSKDISKFYHNFIIWVNWMRLQREVMEHNKEIMIKTF